MGAGVIPFSVRDKDVYFLFQTVFSGRKTGYLIDFGGGLGMGENYQEAAIREFVEETETMYFSNDLQLAKRSIESVNVQIPIVQALFDKTLANHPNYCCKRASINKLKPKDWQSFFVEFPYRDISELNRAWENDQVGRFKKRRELVWVGAEELLAIYESEPNRLWKRVRQLENAREIILNIKKDFTPLS